MKTKWGSCHVDNKQILLNLELAKKPPECLEYILVHELVHLLERKHSERFKNYLDQYLPKWQEIKPFINEGNTLEFNNLKRVVMLFFFKTMFLMLSALVFLGGASAGEIACKASQEDINLAATLIQTSESYIDYLDSVGVQEISAVASSYEVGSSLDKQRMKLIKNFSLISSSSKQLVNEHLSSPLNRAINWAYIQFLVSDSILYMKDMEMFKLVDSSHLVLYGSVLPFSIHNHLEENLLKNKLCK